MGPDITVLMPVYNAQAFLRPAMESILNQTYADFELLIINDGSTDTSRELIASYSDPRIRIVDNPHNMGLIYTLNRGLELARGRFIARQDSDDISHGRRLELQKQYFLDRPQTALLGTQARKIDAKNRCLGRMERPREHLSIRWYHLFDNSFIHTSVMFRRELIWEKFHGYQAFVHCEDYELWSRVMAEHPVANLPDILVDRRTHAQSVIGSLKDDRAKQTQTYIREVMQRDLERIFGDEIEPEKTAYLTSQFRLGLNKDTARHFTDLFEKLYGKFQMRFPQTGASSDFHRTVAIQYAKLAYDLLPQSRGQAIRSYIKSICKYPARICAIPWLQILAIMVLGEGPRKAYHRLRNA